MMRTEREELLRRYLEGEMSLEQEHDFFIQVALDKELRHELKAHQTIERAFQKDRVVDPSRYASLQVSVAGMVAATRPSEPAPASIGTVAVRSAGTPLRRLFMGGLGGLVVLAAFLAYSILDPTGEEASQKEKAVATVPPALQQDKASSGDRAAMKVEASVPAAEIPRNRTAARVSQRSAVRASSSKAGSRRNVEAALSDNEAHISETPPPNTDAVFAADTAVDGSALETRTNDSLPVGVRLRWKK